MKEIIMLNQIIAHKQEEKKVIPRIKIEKNILTLPKKEKKLGTNRKENDTRIIKIH